MKIIDIAIKDLVRSTRSMFLVGMALVAPLVITGLIYFAFGSMASGDVSLTTIQVGVVNADTLPASAPLDEPVGKSIRDMFFDESVETWIEARDYPDETAARLAVDRQEIGVAVLIPQTFSQDYLSGEKNSAITLLQDPTLTIAPNVVRDMIVSLLEGFAGGGVAYQILNESQQNPESGGMPALFESYSDWYIRFQRALFHSPDEAALVVVSPAAEGRDSNPLQTTMGLVMIGQMIFFSFFTGGYAMTTILEEDEEGTLPRLFTTPTGRTAILAGKFLAVFLTVVLQGLFLMAAGRVAFGVQWGQPGSAALSLLGQMVASVGLAALLIAFIKTSKQAGPILGGVLTG
jgi:ABC-2 type transport system permease protein